MNFAKTLPHSSIILSTDDEYFLDNPIYHSVVDPRPAALSGDKIIISDVIREIIDRKNLYSSFIVVLEPTCLPRRRSDLEPIYNGEFIDSGKISFTSFSESPVLENLVKRKKPNDSNPNVWKRRQEYPTQYCLTGHYYGFLASKLDDYYPGLCDASVFPVFIDYDFVDINTTLDLDLANKILRHD